MQLPIVILCIVSAVSAAPQLFFVVPQQFLDNPTQQDFQNFIPLIVPFTQQQSETAPVNRESFAAVEAVDPVPEIAPESTAPELVADVAVAAEEPVIANDVVAAQEVVPDPQQNAQETVETVPAQEQEVVPSSQTVEVSEPVETVQEQEQIAVEAPKEPEIVQEPATNTEAIKSETSIIAAEIPEVQTNELIATQTAENTKTEVSPVIDNSSGKSFNSIASPNLIHHSIVTHFGFRNPASVKSHSNTFTQHGSVVDPKTLVEPQFRHFIYQNDSPDVVAAKIAFFRVQAALTPVKTAQLL